MNKKTKLSAIVLFTLLSASAHAGWFDWLSLNSEPPTMSTTGVGGGGGHPGVDPMGGGAGGGNPPGPVEPMGPGGGGGNPPGPVDPMGAGGGGGHPGVKPN